MLSVTILLSSRNLKQESGANHKEQRLPTYLSSLCYRRPLFQRISDPRTGLFAYRYSSRWHESKKRLFSSSVVPSIGFLMPANFNIGHLLLLLQPPFLKCLPFFTVVGPCPVEFSNSLSWLASSEPGHKRRAYSYRPPFLQKCDGFVGLIPGFSEALAFRSLLVGFLHNG